MFAKTAALAATLAFSIAGATCFAQDIELPKPATSGGAPLLDALAKRSSHREFLAKPLTLQEMADLLWAADGVNRDNGKRTAPSAVNFQEIDVYVLLDSGVYVYDAKANKLVKKSGKDLRAQGGVQPFVKSAPLVLVYVADLSRMDKIPDALGKRLLAHVDTGFISQNVYLFCAAKGYATVVLGMVDRPELFKSMELKEGVQEITYSQPVGRPDVSKTMR